MRPLYTGGAYRWLALKGCSWVRRELIDQRLEDATPKQSLHRPGRSGVKILRAGK